MFEGPQSKYTDSIRLDVSNRIAPGISSPIRLLFNLLQQSISSLPVAPSSRPYPIPRKLPVVQPERLLIFQLHRQSVRRSR